MIICVFCFMWNDRKRKKRYIALQQELTQKRVDTMLLKEEKTSEPNQEHINKKNVRFAGTTVAIMYIHVSNH